MCQNHDPIMRHAIVRDSELISTTWGPLSAPNARDTDVFAFRTHRNAATATGIRSRDIVLSSTTPYPLSHHGGWVISLKSDDSL